MQRLKTAALILSTAEFAERVGRTPEACRKAVRTKRITSVFTNSKGGLRFRFPEAAEELDRNTDRSRVRSEHLSAVVTAPTVRSTIPPVSPEALKAGDKFEVGANLAELRRKVLAGEKVDPLADGLDEVLWAALEAWQRFDLPVISVPFDIAPVSQDGEAEPQVDVPTAPTEG